MDDPLDKLSELSLERKAMITQQAQQYAEFQRKMAEIDERIREVAALVVAYAPTPAPRVVVPAVFAEAEFGDIQPRMRQLLGFVKADPGRHADVYTAALYGEADQATRRSVSAYFSRLKAGEYVTTRGPGLFDLTDKGARAAIDPSDE